MNILDFKRKSLGYTFREGGDQWRENTVDTTSKYIPIYAGREGEYAGMGPNPNYQSAPENQSVKEKIAATLGVPVSSVIPQYGTTTQATQEGDVQVGDTDRVVGYFVKQSDSHGSVFDSAGKQTGVYNPSNKGGGGGFFGNFLADLDSALGLSKAVTGISGGLADLDKDLKLSENAPAILAIAAAVVGAPYLSELIASVGAEAAAAQMVSAGVVSAEAAAGAGLAAGELGLAGGTALGAGNLGVAGAMGGAAGAGTLNALGAGGAAGANALGAGAGTIGTGAGTIGADLAATGVGAGTGVMGAGLAPGELALAGGTSVAPTLAQTGANALAGGAAGAGNALTNYLTSPAGIQAGASLAGGVISAAGANAAANTQADAADRALTLQREIYDSQKALQEPYRAAGITAQNRLLDYLGLSANTGQADYGKYAGDFGMADFQADPGYAFRLSEGQKSLDRQAAARGGLISGGALKAATRYGQEAGSQEYGNAYNRYQTNRTNQLQPLGNLMASGQSAASNVGSAAGQYGTNAANLINQGGQATAAGQLGIGNTINNAIGAGVSAYQNNNLIEMLRRQNTSSYLNPYANP